MKNLLNLKHKNAFLSKMCLMKKRANACYQAKAQSKLNADENDITGDISIFVRDEKGEQKELNLSEIKKAKTFVKW